MPQGFRILPRLRKVAQSDIEAFRSIAVANVSDSMSRMFAGGAALRPMHAGGVMAGPALTVKTRPGDNLMVHKALALAEAGDVLFVDAGGALTNAIVGELMAAFAMSRQLAGLVIFGAVRDCAALRRGTFPVFAAGVTHRGPYKDGPGEINVPVAVDGMVVHPGDLVLGDDDGVVCVPYETVAEVRAAAQAKQVYEEKLLVDTLAGRTDKKWVDPILATLGCEFVS